MTYVKKAPRTATTMKVRSKSEYAISHSKDPYMELMLRLFQDESTALRGHKFLTMVEERQKKREPHQDQRLEAAIGRTKCQQIGILCHEK
jgi:hypothetical protein